MGGEFHELQESFKAQGMRLTYQRKVILDILRGTKLHPTADKVYAEAKRRIPNISLGTVYRNLNVLSGHGMIRELDYGKGLTRYDGNPCPHYHVRCVRCGKVEDVGMPVIEGIKRRAEQCMGEPCCWSSVLFNIGGMDRRAERCTGYLVVEHRVEFQGVCSECAKG